MALREIVAKSLQDEAVELEILNGEPQKMYLLEAQAELIMTSVSLSPKEVFGIVRVLIEHAYCMGYQRGKSEASDNKIEKLLGDIEIEL